MTHKVVVIGAGIGGLTTGALLAQQGMDVTVLEANAYVGGCAGTFFHKGYRFDAGATVAGGFQDQAPHDKVGKQLGLEWNVHTYDPAWTVHLPDKTIPITSTNAEVEACFPHSKPFWEHQSKLAQIGWSLSAQGLPFPPTDAVEAWQLLKVGLQNLPDVIQASPFLLMSVYAWLRLYGLDRDQAFVRFIDAQLLISAQTTSKHTFALYGATALDLARQGVYHAQGGMGGIAEQLATRFEQLGGKILYKHRATHIETQQGKVTGVHYKRGLRSNQVEHLPCDFVVANVTPWTANALLGTHAPRALQRESTQRSLGYGAFVLHLGVHEDAFPPDFADHHQFIRDMNSPLGESTSLFMSVSPRWDATRAPRGYRAVTVTTHTQVEAWWNQPNATDYQARKAQYTQAFLDGIERYLPNFRQHVALTLAGTPITYQFYTGRHKGMVGGFPQTSLLTSRSPRMGIPNMRLVGDSIFPGQSTAGVTLGAVRVAQDVLRNTKTRASAVRVAPVRMEG
ncbi:MAG: phytoene desaturase family protein [Phototrophicaceae bacterium]